MATISQYHKYLFFGKISDSLTPEEANELDKLFADNPEAEMQFQELVKTLPAAHVRNAYNFLNEPGYWKDITGDYKKVKSLYNKQFIVRRLSIAAVIAGIAVVGLLVWFIGRNDGNKSILASLRPKSYGSIELKLANGKVIDLSKQKGSIIEHGIVMKNGEKSLTYEVRNADDNGINTVTVPTGMDYKIILNDGSQVWMNSTTILTFPTQFSKTSREVTLSGEAYLQISKDSKKPFLVHLPNSTVQVTGTEFNVNSYDSGIVKVALIKGGVNLSSKISSIKIKSGNEGIYNRGQQSLLQQPFNVSNVLSWQKGLFYFDEANLNDLSKVLLRWFGTETIIDNAGLKNKKFAGVLDKNKPIETFLRNLKIISKIESYFDKNGTLHFK